MRRELGGCLWWALECGRKEERARASRNQWQGARLECGACGLGRARGLPAYHGNLWGNSCRGAGYPVGNPLRWKLASHRIGGGLRALVDCWKSSLGISGCVTFFSDLWELGWKSGF